MQFRLTFIFLPILAVAVTLVAQGPPGMSRQYDPKTETTVTGVVEVVTHPAGRNGMVGTHLTLKTEIGPVDVHIGPQSYVEKQGFTFEKGDSITVTGSKQVMGGRDVLIAKEVKKGDKVLTLRNANGLPAWSGRGAASN